MAFSVFVVFYCFPTGKPVHSKQHEPRNTYINSEQHSYLKAMEFRVVVQNIKDTEIMRSGRDK